MPTNTRWKCPFCDTRGSKEDLCLHIEKNHMDELPEGFTPLRAVFHAVNRKDFNYVRPCRICKKPTKWDEKKGRYDFLCDNPQCHSSYVAYMHKVMGDKCGKFRPTETAEGLEKMLAGRKISGKYKFSNGKEVVYTGSYERKALEFMDSVINIKPEDLMIPGPPMKYVLDGETKIYIPDMYYIPYNLIIEIKDGGTNPNKAWKDSRRRTLAKEEYIIKHTDYNYIRLTNNSFDQLLHVFADLKMSLVDDAKDDKAVKRIIHVNETSGLSAIHAAFPKVNNNDVIVVNYLQNNVFSGKSNIAVADDIKFDRIFKENSVTGILEETDKSFLKECKYTTYIVSGVKNKVYRQISSSLGHVVEEGFLYEAVFGHKCYTNDQIMFEESAKEYEDYYTNLHNIDSQINNILRG